MNFICIQFFPNLTKPKHKSNKHKFKKIYRFNEDYIRLSITFIKVININLKKYIDTTFFYYLFQDLELIKKIYTLRVAIRLS